MNYVNFRQLRTKLGGRSRSSIYLDIAAGRLPKPFKLGGVNFWIEAEVDELLQSMARAASADPTKQDGSTARSLARPGNDGHG